MVENSIVIVGGGLGLIAAIHLKNNNLCFSNRKK
jgi:monoamine oxidase